MSPERLLEHFDQISEAPDAVPRLRRFILDLAVRGKLVEQDPKDEPAAVLLEQILDEKRKRLGKRSSADDGLLEVNDVEYPFEIPSSWLWLHATLPAILISDNGKKIQTKDVLASGTYPVVDQGKMFIRGYCNDERKVTHIETPVIIFGDHTRETKLVDFDFVVGADGVKILQPIIINPNFYFLALQWLPLNSRGYGRHFKLLRASFFPLPPLSEQHRIVAKVDELMKLCDVLEATQEKRERWRDRLVAATLHGMNNGDANDENNETLSFEESGRFYFNHLPRLTTRPNHIQQLRQAILNLAVRGKLVPQDPKDEPATVLLERIELVKRRLIASGTIKRDRFVPEMSDIEAPFVVPFNWTWGRFVNVAAIQSNLVKPQDYPKHPHIAPDNIESGTGKLLPYETIAESKVFSAKHLFFPGHIIYSKIRPNLAKAAIVNFEGLCSADAYPIYPLINIYYLLKFMLSAAFVRQSIKEDNRVAMPKINQEALSAILVAVPPLAEQHRIVAKVDELMKLCDELETKITTTSTTRRQFIDSVLLEALTPAITCDASKGEGLQKTINIRPVAEPTHRPNKHFARALLSAEIVHQLHDEPTFGRTKHQKILHLCEYIAQIEEIAGEYHREAAGPLDNRMIYSVEAELKKQHWYEEYRRDKFGHAYRPLEKAGGHRKYIERYWSDKLPVIQLLVDKMRTWDTERCEIFATGYAAWNDLIIWNRDSSDKAILKEILERWHEAKKRISEDRWLKALAWMRKEGFTPVGFGKSTCSETSGHIKKQHSRK